MTNTQKHEMLASVELLHEAHKEIEKFWDEGNRISIQSILADSQNVAMALGEYIEKLEGERDDIVPHIADYCEILFQIYEELEGGAVPPRKIYKKLKKQLILVENSIKNNIITKIQVVFFPYKASMWDSLESVYLSAKADQRCDVYCVPIPYYDLNPDQSFGKMHYEAKDYPDYVEVIDWQTYDFENIKPDVAYIHNPYDEYNLVTSVHPRYYSKNLKKYVGTLVYIPYYVTGGTLGKMHSVLPSYFYVDYIIAQHERQIPLFASEISNKIMALGSPKFDRVINQVITDDMIREEWKSRLSDTVLFLNTGIDGLLKHEEKSLLKIQYILEVAKEENVTLLWRPHPLLEATIKSMRPELWELYLETVEKFGEYQKGILDRSGNAELAIGISDAYIGEDTSSISHMFGVLGKPLFFIRQGILDEKEDAENIKLSCCTADTINNEGVWACTASRNGLLRISASGSVEEFYIIPNEKDRSNLYSDILINGNKLYLVPRNAREIAIFDIINKQFTKIALSKPGKKEKFNKGFLFENDLYLIPRLYEEMVVLHCDGENLSYNASVVHEMKELTEIPDILVSANGSRLIGESIYITAPNKPYLLEYNIRTEEITIHKIPGTEDGICCMEKVSDRFVFGCMNKCELVVWDPVSENSDVIVDFPEKWGVDDDICFWDIIELEGEAYIFPRKSPMILKLSVDKLTIEPLKEEFPFSIEKRKSAFFNHPNHFLLVKKLSDNNVLVQDANRHGISKFFTDGSFRWHPVELSKDDNLRTFGEKFTRLRGNLPWGIYETRDNSIRYLIWYVQRKMHDAERQKDAFADAAVHLDGTAGQTIHDFIMKSQ